MFSYNYEHSQSKFSVPQWFRNIIFILITHTKLFTVFYGKLMMDNSNREHHELSKGHRMSRYPHSATTQAGVRYYEFLRCNSEVSVFFTVFCGKYHLLQRPPRIVWTWMWLISITQIIYSSGGIFPQTTELVYPAKTTNLSRWSCPGQGAESLLGWLREDYWYIGSIIVTDKDKPI